MSEKVWDPIIIYFIQTHAHFSHTLKTPIHINT